MASQVASLATPLELYRRAFVASSPDHLAADRTEILVEIEPGDEIARVSARLALSALSEKHSIPILQVSSPSHDVLEITKLASSRDDVLLSTQVSSTGITIYARAQNRGLTLAGLRIRFNLWEACAPATGTVPYLSSTLAVAFSPMSARTTSTLLTLSTPESSSPRATRGNYSLAYPSRTERGRRLTNIYFQTQTARLTYTFGSDAGLTTPWLNLGRAGVTALAIYIVAAVASQIPSGDRFTALIAVFVGAAGLLWDFSREVASFAVYGATKSWITVLVLAAQVLVLGVLGFAVWALTANNALLTVTGILSLAVGAALTLFAVIALIGHRQGFWQRFSCDAEGCTSVFRWRRARPECTYTGRVHCKRHMSSLCASCVHGPDLLSGRLDTANQLGTTSLPCVVFVGNA